VLDPGRLVAAASLGVWLATALGGPARAHLGHVVLRAERYFKVDASAEETRVVVSLTLGADEGRRLLDGADLDRDGAVSQAEADAYMLQWAAGLAEELPIEVDGAPVELVWGEPFLDPIGPVRATPLTVEMVARLPTPGREHQIVLHDRMVRREVFDRTDVAFRAHDGAELLTAGAGPAAQGRETTLSYGRAAGPAPDALSARIRYPSHSEPTSEWVWVAALLLATLVGAVGIRWARRRPAVGG
jgi:hypothetical protein